ncbi:MAG: lipoate--protein ligase family protein [Candidatus Aminicenantes bacterium]|nr:lipoate--protein ligase family protein [Candidatus Aminicenantes bacterium]
MKKWRLIIDKEPQIGARNMAIDEYLVNSLKEGETVLRFYTWLKPTASLGYGQKIEKVLDLEACRRLGIDVVRRPTGGKLVLHYKEVTYSVCSSDCEIFTETLEGSYKKISQALIAGLKFLGVEAELSTSIESAYARSFLPCFAFPARHEIVVNNRKVIGSAQRRWGHRFLQHGSIALQPHDHWLRQITPIQNLDLSLKMISLEEVLGRPVDPKEVIAPLTEGFRQFFQVDFENKPLSQNELEQILIIEKNRYSHPSWTFF